MDFLKFPLSNGDQFEYYVKKTQHAHYGIKLIFHQKSVPYQQKQQSICYVPNWGQMPYPLDYVEISHLSSDITRSLPIQIKQKIMKKWCSQILLIMTYLV